MTFEEYQEKGLKTLLPTANNIPYVALGLTNEAGEVAGKVKKWVRDSDGDMTKLNKTAVADEIGDVLWYAAMLSQLIGVSMADIAQMNVDKLASREQRGKLKGSGDNR